MEHGVCPGGDHPMDSGVLCCDACWARIPTRVPGYDEPWRRARLRARSIRSWSRFEEATDAARAWLVAHPLDTP